jgi:CHASE2 domain-containing sensor protein
MMESVAKQFGESKGWTWALFVLSSCAIGLAGMATIIDLNGTANNMPIIVGAVIIGLFVLGYFALTLHSIRVRSAERDGI